MKRIKKMIVFIILALLCLESVCQAGGAKKLGRGLADAGLGWTELFKTVDEKNTEYDYMVGALYGIPEGVVRACARTLVGVYEILTFPFPAPGDYDVIMTPEFVFESKFEKTR